jgi:hypothetical protein
LFVWRIWEWDKLLLVDPIQPSLIEKVAASGKLRAVLALHVRLGALHSLNEMATFLAWPDHPQTSIASCKKFDASSNEDRN